MEPERKKQCIDLRGEDSDDSVVCTGSAPAPAPSKSMKTMKEVIRAAGLGVADLVERSDVEARYEQALARLEEADRMKAPSATSATSSNDDVSTAYAWRILHCPATGGPDSPGNRGAITLSEACAGRPKWVAASNYMISGRTLERILPQMKTVERCIIFHGEAGTARHLASCFPRAEIHDMTPRKLRFVHARTGKVLDMNYSCHHAKFFLVGFEDYLRVMIHSSNLINDDCFKKTQGV